jgi:hypothetical protein
MPSDPAMAGATPGATPEVASPAQQAQSKAALVQQLSGLSAAAQVARSEAKDDSNAKALLEGKATATQALTLAQTAPQASVQALAMKQLVEAGASVGNPVTAQALTDSSGTGQKVLTEVQLGQDFSVSLLTPNGATASTNTPGDTTSNPAAAAAEPGTIALKQNGKATAAVMFQGNQFAAIPKEQLTAASPVSTADSMPTAMSGAGLDANS